MDTINHILKLLTLLGLAVLIIELLPVKKQVQLENYIRRKLTLKSYLKSVYVFILTIILVSLYLNFAGTVMFYIIGIFFLLLGMVISLAFANFDNVYEGILGDYKGKIVFIIVLYVLAFISWIIPFESLFFLFYPYEKLTEVFLETPVLSWVFPHFKSTEFYFSFKEMSANVENNIFQETKKEWYFYVMPGWIFFQCTSLFSFITILIAEILFFVSLFRIIVFSVTSLYFPIFQLADYIKTKSNLEKNRIPIMGIIITILSSILNLFI
ncbi:hypothetical protein WIW50_02705 [Flavobacteriaceae bacterium 3-367]